MKKNLFFVGIAAAAMLASCSNDETVEMSQSKAIKFESFVNMSTRGIANDITKENITNFSVYGFMTNVSGQIFTNEAVTGSGNNWNYANTQYWTADKDYWFSAIAPTTNAQWTYDVNNTTEGGIITFENKDGKQDLLYAYSGKIHCDNPVAQSKVGFTFNHLLSRVKFNFTNSMGNNNTKLIVKNVTITDANGKATCDVSKDEKVWTLTEDNTKGNLVFDAVPNAETKIGNNKSIATDHKYMIPQNQAYKLTFTVEMYQGEVLANTYTHTDIVVPQTDMLAGNSYVFNAELKPENIDPEGKLYPIEFTVTDIPVWNDEWEGSTVTVPEM